MTEKITNRIKTLLGVTRSEIVVGFLIFVGLLVGGIFRYLDNSNVDITEAEKELRNVYEQARSENVSFASSDEEKLPEKKRQIIDKTKNTNKKIDVININKASIDELVKLPGVGKVTAKKIISYRSDHKFETIEDIIKVKGIGQKKFEKMKDFIKVQD